MDGGELPPGRVTRPPRGRRTLGAAPPGVRHRPIALASPADRDLYAEGATSTVSGRVSAFHDLVRAQIGG